MRKPQMKRFLLIYAAFNLVFASIAYAGPMNFPHIPRADDEDVIESYTPYVTFISEVAKSVDSARAEKFMKLFEQLKKADSQQTVQFLKGLRLELLHGIELSDGPTRNMKSSSPQVRRVVARSLKNWVSDLDESIFRHASKGIANSQSE